MMDERERERADGGSERREGEGWYDGDGSDSIRDPMLLKTDVARHPEDMCHAENAHTHTHGPAVAYSGGGNRSLNFANRKCLFLSHCCVFYRHGFLSPLLWLRQSLFLSARESVCVYPRHMLYPSTGGVEGGRETEEER